MAAFEGTRGSRRLQVLTLASTLASTLMAVPSLARAAPAVDPAGAPAEGAAAVDEVTLESGGFVTGKLTEYLPGDHVTIIPAGSSEPRIIAWSEVDHVTRGGQRLDGGESQEPPLEEPAPGGGWEDPTAGVGDESTQAIATTMEAQPEPEPEGIQVRVRQQGGKQPAALYHIDGEATGVGNGVTVHAIAYSEVCTAPCEGVIVNPGGEYFVGGKPYMASRRFKLPRTPAGHDVLIKPRHRALSYLGWTLLVAGVSGATVMLTTSFVSDMPISTARGLRAGGAVLGAAALGGGITLMVFGRTKVELMPARP